MLTALQTIELHSIIVIAFTLRLLLRDGMLPSSRMAWFMVILTVPFAGGVLYFLFGEVDLGHRAERRHREIFASLNAHARATLDSPHAEISEQMQPAFAYAQSVNGFRATGGNRVALMPGAQAARDALIADIDAARDSVHILCYIWLTDTTGTNTARALIRAAGRGVKCRVMVDGLGSRSFTRSRLWQEMAAAGVELAIALPIDKPIRTLLTSRIDLRNHRKITVIDGRIGYTGSQNCADPEFRIKAKYAPWVDILLRFEGPVVAQLQLLFASDWLKERDTPLAEFVLETTVCAEDVTAAAIGDGPTERFGASPQMFCTLIESARRELVITTPYFVPDPTVIDALCATALRGVNVTLILPKHNDSWVVAAASRSYYRRFLQAGGQIWEYRPGLLHTKSMTIDGKALFIGSSNLDMRSFDLNYENDVLIEDEGVTRAMLARQMEYLSDSEQVTLDDIAAWGIHWRMWQNALATIGPVL